MFNQLEYQTVVFAALLHDIGKFLQRGSFGSLDTKGKHPEVSTNFVSAFGDNFKKVADVPLLRTLVQRHHESPQFPSELQVQTISDHHTRALAYLVSKADNLSSAERGEQLEGWKDYKSVPLVSVFRRVKLESPEEPGLLRHHPLALGETDSLQSIFPSQFEQLSKTEMNKLLQSFGNDFRALLRHLDTSRFECICTHLLGILQRYTWCIPSNTQEEFPDVSLYDHLRTTTAIAACLYKYHSEKGTLDEKHIKKDDDERFYLVIGDLSGIQSYIFDIATTGAGGVAKRLRARSLFVQLIIEAVSHKLIKSLGLPLTNVIMSSGGKFYCLLPNNEEAISKVKEIQQEVDRWLLEHLNADIALNIGGFIFGDTGFSRKPNLPGGFGTIVAKSAENLALRKLRRFGDVMATPQGWREEDFTLNISFEGQNECLSCRKFPRIDGQELCSRCQLDLEVGAQIPKATYIAFFDNQEDGKLPLAGYSASLISEPRQLRQKPYLLLKLNRADLNEVAEFPALPKYVASHVALHPGCNSCQARDRCRDRVEASGTTDIAAFGCIANRSNGRPYLGFLKADADNMGQIFSFGLKREQAEESQSYDTISRLSTLSRQLDLFFTGWIQNLAEKDFPDCYTVFSGGDDMFFAGPWDRIVAFAERINQDFHKLTANADMTLSVGIVVAQSSYPIARAADRLDRALEKSKDSGRNRLTLLGSTLTWHEWSVVKEQWETLKPFHDAIPSAFLYSLAQYGEMWQRYRAGDAIGLRYQPLLAYNIARNLNQRDIPEVYAWAEQLLRLHPEDAKQRIILDYLGLIATLLILSRERGG